MFLVPLNQKPRLNVGTIGHIDHGKTTLVAALSARLARRFPGISARPYFDIAAGGTARDETRVVTITASKVEYESAQRHWCHVDCPGHRDYIRSTIVAISQMDAAILVVSAVDGCGEQTREHLLLARAAGVGHVIVFLNKLDRVEDPELLDLAEREVRELLNHCSFPGDSTPVIRGSALPAARNPSDDKACASIDALVAALDTCVPLPRRNLEPPFLMPIVKAYRACDPRFQAEHEQWARTTGRKPIRIFGRVPGTVVTGRVERGSLRVGEAVEVVGLRNHLLEVSIAVGSIWFFRTPLNAARAGDNVGVLLPGIDPDQIRHGQVLAAFATVVPSRVFEAEIALLKTEEGGRHTPFRNGYRPQFYIRTADVPGTVTLLDDVREATPGATVRAAVCLNASVAIEPMLRFSVVEGRRLIGAGKITRLQH